MLLLGRAWVSGAICLVFEQCHLHLMCRHPPPKPSGVAAHTYRQQHFFPHPTPSLMSRVQSIPSQRTPGRTRNGRPSWTATTSRSRCRRLTSGRHSAAATANRIHSPPSADQNRAAAGGGGAELWKLAILDGGFRSSSSCCCFGAMRDELAVVGNCAAAATCIASIQALAVVLRVTDVLVVTGRISAISITVAIQVIHRLGSGSLNQIGLSLTTLSHPGIVSLSLSTGVVSHLSEAAGTRYHATFTQTSHSHHHHHP